MRTIRLLLMLVIAIAVLPIISCSKKEGPTSVIQYEIEDFDNYFTLVKYSDEAGNMVTIDNPANFPGGTKTISVNAKPFTAVLEAKVNNTTNATRNYVLRIIVDGKIMTFENLQVMPFTIGSATAQFTVN